MSSIISTKLWSSRLLGRVCASRFSVQKWRAEEREELIAAIRENPHRYVGQEQAGLSTAPVWSNGAPEPRPLVLRTYITAAGDSYSVMPGGLTRISTGAAEIVVSMQKGGGSKDTWVLSDGPVNMVSLLTPVGPSGSFWGFLGGIAQPRGG